MATAIPCSTCGQTILVNDGERIVCPHCQEREAAKALFAAPTRTQEVHQAEPDPGPQIEFVCPFCSETYPVSEQLAGKKINCRNCYEPARVPENRKEQIAGEPNSSRAAPASCTRWAYRFLTHLATAALVLACLACLLGWFASLALLQGRNELFGWLLFSAFILAFLAAAGSLAILHVVLHRARTADQEIEMLKRRISELDQTDP